MKIPQTIANLFNQGKLIIFPTDTVWGVGCSLEHQAAISRLYRLKHRVLAQPTAVLIANPDQAERLGQFSDRVKSAAQQIWPGPVTLIVPATDQAPEAIIGQEKKIGLRIPDHPWLLQVLESVPSGVVATSANFAGRPEPLNQNLIEPEFRSQVDVVVEGVEAGEQAASTVVDTTTRPPTVLREGSIGSPEIKRIFAS